VTGSLHAKLTWLSGRSVIGSGVVLLAGVASPEGVAVDETVGADAERGLVAADGEELVQAAAAKITNAAVMLLIAVFNDHREARVTHPKGDVGRLQVSDQS
jgi:hypothetical protein